MRFRLVLVLVVSVFVIFSCEVDGDVPLNNQTTLDPLVQYEVKFNGLWNGTSHPTDYPANAHFSKMFVSTHNNTSVLFELDSLASPAIEAMAETGETTLLMVDFDAHIANNRAHSYQVGVDILNEGEDSLVIAATPEFSLLSFVSMIAPSPDWFVGLDDFNLINSNNEWIETAEIFLESYDAGTDSGATFLDPDVNTVPQDSIKVLVAAPLGNGINVNPSVAKITITKM